MNSINAAFVASPFGNEEECAVLTIDDTAMPFTLHDVMNAGLLHTLSFWIRSEAAGSVTVLGKVIATTTEWERVELEFTSEKTDLSLLFTLPGTYYIYRLKLEVGNKATDWTPAPEDVDSDISAAAKTATNYLKFDDGLVIGDMTANKLGNNVLIDSESVNIRNGEKILASFDADTINLGLEDSSAKINLLDGLGSIYANGFGQLQIHSRSTNIHTRTINDSGYGIAEVCAQSTTSDALKPMLTLSCRAGIPGSVSGSGAFFEAEILRSADITITDERIVFSGPFVTNYTQCVLDENGFRIAGDLTVDGSYGEINCGPILASGEIVSDSANAFRAKQGDYGFFIRNDGSNVYFMLTKAGDSSGNWNDLRPLIINCADGQIASPVTAGATTSSAANVHITGAGIFQKTSTTSSRTIKHDIEELSSEDLVAENLYNLPVRQFKYNEDIITDKNDVRYMKNLPGFIIEEMNEAYPIAVDKPSDNVKEWSWNAQYLIPPMLKLIQDLHKEIEQLKGKVS